MAENTIAGDATASPIAGLGKLFGGFNNLPQKNKLALLIGVPILIAILSSALLWSRDATYKVLFSNISDADGGAIIASLTQMNIPYRHSESGNAILVPMDKVHDVRLKLASQGLPKGSIVGFELLENQKLGITQFQEQINFQRGLEGELARSISTLSGVQTARVHLAIPKPSIFLRDQQKPTASVVLNLGGGRYLDKTQIQGIVHLVASSVPDLSAKSVSIVDQAGNLLTNNENGQQKTEASQLNYIQTLEHNYAKRLMDILTPIFGAENVRATVTADVDFAQVESTEENYKPNGDPARATMRSQQSSESSTPNPTNPQGVPGTLTNQPPGAATAPIAANPQTGVPGQTTPPTANAAPASTRKEATINYEVDKTVKVVKSQIGNIKRISAAVVINNKSIVTPKGETKSIPLTPEETTQINELVKEAIGFNKERGDTINIVNQMFTKKEEKPVEIWQNPEFIDLIKATALPLGVALVAALLIFGIFKPLLRAPEKDEGPELLPEPNKLAITVGEENAALLAEIGREEGAIKSKQERMEKLRTLAKENPQLVANIVKNWVVGE
jgi:flagellar M-ring protein FliF